ncbi:MAG: Thioredoxin reductase, partial [candidate division TM6 bacterium GW2011_GWA2_36_9]
MSKVWLLLCGAFSLCASHTILDGEKYHLNNLRGQHNVVSMVVLGSGPAGCAAATYGARAGMDVLVFEGPLPGG